MPGLKAMAVALEGVAQAGAAWWHAAGVGISGAASFAIAGGVAHWFGPAAAFLLGGATALAALLLAGLVMPATVAKPSGKAASRRLLDFRPGLQYRAAMGRSVADTRRT